MNKSYILKLLETNRFGHVIKLMQNNRYAWSMRNYMFVYYNSVFKSAKIIIFMKEFMNNDKLSDYDEIFYNRKMCYRSSIMDISNNKTIFLEYFKRVKVNNQSVDYINEFMLGATPIPHMDIIRYITSDILTKLCNYSKMYKYNESDINDVNTLKYLFSIHTMNIHQLIDIDVCAMYKTELLEHIFSDDIAHRFRFNIITYKYKNLMMRTIMNDNVKLFKLLTIPNIYKVNTDCDLISLSKKVLCICNKHKFKTKILEHIRANIDDYKYMLPLH